MEPQRIMLIDAGYLYAASEAFGGFPGTEESFRKLRDAIQDKFGEITDTYYFDARDTNPRSASANEYRQRECQRAGIMVKLMDMKRDTRRCPKCKNTVNFAVQAGVDVAIAVQAMTFALESNNNEDEIIWLAGDGDFVECLASIKRRRLRMHLVAFKNSCSSKLIQYCQQDIMWLSEPDVFKTIIPNANPGVSITPSSVSQPVADVPMLSSSVPSVPVMIIGGKESGTGSGMQVYSFSPPINTDQLSAMPPRPPRSSRRSRSHSPGAVSDDEAAAIKDARDPPVRERYSVHQYVDIWYNDHLQQHGR